MFSSRDLNDVRSGSWSWTLGSGVTALTGQRGRRFVGREEGGRLRRTLRRASFLRLRRSDLLSSNPLSQHHKGVADLEVGPSNRDMALIVRACQRISIDSSAGDVVDLPETLPALTDGMYS
jgi:hypothetical protein